MKSDPELDALVAALRTDLPSERDSARLRARLSALGLASSEALLSSAAAASTSATHAAALGSAGEVAVQAGGVSWALKAGAIAVVSVSAIGAPAWFAYDRLGAATPAANDSSASANARSNVTSGAQRRSVGDAKTDPSPARLDVGREPGASSARGGATAPSSEELARTPGAAPAATPRANELSAAGTTPSANVATDTARVQAGASTASFAEGSDSAATTPEARLAERTTLREETALIDRALSALRTGEASRAAALLAEHEHRFPNGLLAQERERAQRKLDEMGRAQGAR